MIKRKKNIFDPEIEGAVGSRNSPRRHRRNQNSEAKRIIDDAYAKIMKKPVRLHKKALQKLDVCPGIKEKLYTYSNQAMNNMQHRYLTTAEDEMAKKFRNLVDNEEERLKNK